MFLGRRPPLDRNEIAAWAEKLNAADPQLREGFVRELKVLSLTL
jgi:hypothetical protein